MSFPLTWKQARRFLALLGLSGATMLLLDVLAFRSLRAGAWTGDVARWTFSDWADRREVLARRGRVPTVLFLGDSTMARDLRPSLITPEGFNLARTGLRAAELGELSVRLEAMGMKAPKLIVLSLLAEQFRPLESDLAFLDEPRPGLHSVVGTFYRDPQRAQLAVLPGTRVLRYRLEGWLKGLEERNTDIEVLSDGTLNFLGPLPDAHLHPPMPGFLQGAPNFLDEPRASHLRRFVRRWEAKGARLIWVRLPLHPALFPAYQQRFAADQAALDRVLETCFPGRVMDLSQPLPADHYWDATHLNSVGAETLSRRLGPLLAPHLRELGIPVSPGMLDP